MIPAQTVISQGWNVWTRTHKWSWVKVLRAKHPKINLFQSQLKLFKSCPLILFKNGTKTTSYPYRQFYFSQSYSIALSQPITLHKLLSQNQMVERFSRSYSTHSVTDFWQFSYHSWKIAKITSEKAKIKARFASAGLIDPEWPICMIHKILFLYKISFAVAAESLQWIIHLDNGIPMYNIAANWNFCNLPNKHCLQLGMNSNHCVHILPDSMIACCVVVPFVPIILRHLDKIKKNRLIRMKQGVTEEIVSKRIKVGNFWFWKGEAIIPK